ncbi:hypothetical protein BH24ACT19_BH24ACT19_09260 [soil metagenome]|jgi:uncharacterized protein (DUF305 family)
MLKTRYLLVGLALVLLIVGAGVAFAHDEEGSTTEGNSMDSMMGEGGMGSMMDGEGMSGGQMMGSFDEEEPFDLQFIDQMIMHHQGAIMSSRHMISDSERPELRQLAENIEESQSEQIEQMQEWREEWYGDDAGQSSGMMGNGMMEGMMGGSMQGMMGGDMADVMFLRMMIPHHQLAIDMSEEALEEAEHPELEELAQTIIEEQAAEIELMRGYLEDIES